MLHYILPRQAFCGIKSQIYMPAKILMPKCYSVTHEFKNLLITLAESSSAKSDASRQAVL